MPLPLLARLGGGGGGGLGIVRDLRGSGLGFVSTRAGVRSCLVEAVEPELRVPK